ncbi:YaaC family protein [Halobacillus sp. Marseille-Q1614]|uniref:YaaC family protein n=1 Tax=Halobacillus sp. Marseille-Q1614 TaxID=2709134 RepID=UPI00157083AD|nr:YaaC family protein [Halobacillus sp. Marseille-Q1614]
MDERHAFLTYLKAASHARSYLHGQYEKLQADDAKTLAYQNVERFMYGLSLGEEYFTAAKHTPISVQPLLYYYSLTHFLKSCILTVDPTYPSSVKVLAHGLSTRKRKKQHYRFLEDEIRIQPHGLFPYAAKCLFQMEDLPSKVSMSELLEPLPFMKPIFKFKSMTTETSAPFPKLIAEFAVLYNLSMLVRYEDEWWGEMEQLRDREDYVFIKHYLEKMPEEIPELISSWLYEYEIH